MFAENVRMTLRIRNIMTMIGWLAWMIWKMKEMTVVLVVEDATQSNMPISANNIAYDLTLGKKIMRGICIPTWAQDFLCPLPCTYLRMSPPPTKITFIWYVLVFYLFLCYCPFRQSFRSLNPWCKVYWYSTLPSFHKSRGGCHFLGHGDCDWQEAGLETWTLELTSVPSGQCLRIFRLKLL